MVNGVIIPIQQIQNILILHINSHTQMFFCYLYTNLDPVCFMIKIVWYGPIFNSRRFYLNNFGRNIQGWINEPVSIFYSGQNPSHCYSDTLIVTVIGDSQRYNGIQYGYLNKCHWATKTQNCSKYNTIYINWVNIVYLRKLTFLKI